MVFSLKWTYYKEIKIVYTKCTELDEPDNEKKLRCIYENEEVQIRHGIAEFESGEKEAEMTVVLKKDGLLWRMETGATPLKINKC